MNDTTPRNHFGMVRGHALMWGGAAFDNEKNRLWANAPFTKVVGRALCECGLLSNALEGDEARREWHRQHKAAIRETREVKL